MDGVLTICFVFLLACALPVFAGATWLAIEQQKPVRPSRTAVSWFFRETAAYAVTILLLPTGWWPVSPKRKHKQQDIADRGDHQQRVPVLLVPGYAMNRSCFTFLQTYLHTRGWEWVWAINNGPRSSPIPVFSKRLGRAIERLCEESGAEQIDIIGHSMGGIVAAYAMKEFRYASKVRKLITLGTPWSGTKTHVFGWRREGLDFAPDSEVIQALQGFEGDTTAIWSQKDHLVLPSHSAAPAHAACLEVLNLGHQEMMTSARCFRLVADVLIQTGTEE